MNSKGNMTAVEWLVSELPHLEADLLKKIIQQAKQIEKEQIIDAYDHGVCNEDITAGQYYNETFKSE